MSGDVNVLFELTYADHLDAHPEIATRANAEAMAKLRKCRWKSFRHRGPVCALANQLKVPNHHRNSHVQIVKFLELLMLPLWRQVIINEQAIVVDSIVSGSRVKKIGRDRRLSLENGKRISPLELDPTYQEMYT